VTQEAGLVAGNAMLVAGALGLRGRLHHRFDQAAVEELLGVAPPDESVLSVVTLHRPGSTPRRAPGAVGEVVPAPARPAVDARMCAKLLALDAAARAEEAGDPLAAAGDGCPLSHDDDGDSPDLADLLRARTSGGGVFNPVRRPVPLRTVVRCALDPYDTDVTAGGVGPAVSCYVWTRSVDDAPAGVYRLTAGRLEPLEDGAEAAVSLTARIHNGYPADAGAEALGLPAGHAPLFQIIVGRVAPAGRYQRSAVVGHRRIPATAPYRAARIDAWLRQSGRGFGRTRHSCAAETTRTCATATVPSCSRARRRTNGSSRPGVTSTATTPSTTCAQIFRPRSGRR
jgi:hypothetical protein